MQELFLIFRIFFCIKHIIIFFLVFGDLGHVSSLIYGDDFFAQTFNWRILSY
jgi:hypothetical protein